MDRIRGNTIGLSRFGKGANQEIHPAESAGWRGVGVPREMRYGRLPPIEKKDDDLGTLRRVDVVIYISKCIRARKNVKGKMLRMKFP